MKAIKQTLTKRESHMINCAEILIIFWCVLCYYLYKNIGGIAVYSYYPLWLGASFHVLRKIEKELLKNEQ